MNRQAFRTRKRGTASGASRPPHPVAVLVENANVQFKQTVCLPAPRRPRPTPGPRPESTADPSPAHLRMRGDGARPGCARGLGVHRGAGRGPSSRPVRPLTAPRSTGSPASRPRPRAAGFSFAACVPRPGAPRGPNRSRSDIAPKRRSFGAIAGHQARRPPLIPPPTHQAARLRRPGNDAPAEPLRRPHPTLRLAAPRRLAAGPADDHGPPTRVRPAGVRPARRVAAPRRPARRDGHRPRRRLPAPSCSACFPCRQWMHR